MRHLHIDVETFSSTSLKGAGMYRYTEAKDFEIMLLSYSEDKDLATCIDLMEDFYLPDWLLEAFVDPDVLKIAHNAAFERTTLMRHLKIYLPPEQWFCTMVHASMVGLPMSLEMVGKVLNLAVQKDTTAKALLKYFTEPCKPTAANGMRTRNLPVHAPEKWEAFMRYNIQDVEAEKAIYDKLSFYVIPPFERDLWALDQRINERGVMVSQQLINSALAIDKIYREHLIREATEITGLSNPNSVNQLKAWLSQEMPLDDIQKLRKEDVTELLKNVKGYENESSVKRMLHIRQEMAKTSIRKYASMLKYVCADKRIHGILQMYGAGRTGRWAGRGIQPHNYPRIDDLKKTYAFARQLVLAQETDEIDLVFKNVSDTLSKLLRTTFIAAPGKRLIVADFSAIEACGIAWLANEKWRLEAFRRGEDIYIVSASRTFKIPVELITDILRQMGKVTELALGFQGGENAIEKMDTKKVIPVEERKQIVTAWRLENPAIVNLWKLMNDAAILAVDTGQRTTVMNKVHFFTQKGVLFMQLPSGRLLSYMRPAISKTMCIFVKLLKDHGKHLKDSSTLCTLREADILIKNGIVKENGQPFERSSLSYEGIIKDTNKWGRIPTYGGKLVENAVQAIARDCLAHAMLNLDKAGYNIVLHVHDEVINEMPEGVGSLDECIEIMTQLPDWAKGLPLRADGFEGSYYRK